ncbi:MAG: hypothetical protein K6E62_11665 [Lachnospiraceae bacterium]|nr:hypothetical protein [Lachnospiraceae bacterium]
MRFGDVQDTSRKEAKTEIREMALRCLEKQMRWISELRKELRLATINGITFTV